MKRPMLLAAVSAVIFFTAVLVPSAAEQEIICTFAESTVKFTGAVLGRADNWCMGASYYRIELAASGKNYIIIGNNLDNYLLNPRVNKGMKCRRSGSYMSRLAGCKRAFGEVKNLSAIKTKGKRDIKTVSGREVYCYTLEEEGLLTEVYLVKTPAEVPLYIKQSIPKLNMQSEIIYKSWDLEKKVKPSLFLPDSGYKLIEVDEKKYEESLKQLGDCLKPYAFY